MKRTNDHAPQSKRAATDAATAVKNTAVENTAMACFLNHAHAPRDMCKFLHLRDIDSFRFTSKSKTYSKVMRTNVIKCLEVNSRDEMETKVAQFRKSYPYEALEIRVASDFLLDYDKHCNDKNLRLVTSEYDVLYEGGGYRVIVYEGVTSIKKKTFWLCTHLMHIRLPSTLTSIEESAFGKCGLRGVIFPEGLTSIGKDAFSSCKNLTLVMFPNTLTSIGQSAFSSCDSLTSINLPHNVKIIEGSTFSACNGLTSVTFPKHLTCIKQFAFFGCSLSSVTFPKGLTCIKTFAFYKCKVLTSVIFQSTFTKVEHNAFEDCRNISSLIFPKEWNCDKDFLWEHTNVRRLEDLAPEVADKILTREAKQLWEICESRRKRRELRL